jgi:hypothetical protein
MTEQLRAARQLQEVPAKYLVPTNTTIQFGRIFFAVSQLLALPASPNLYVQTDQPGALRTVFQEAPGSVAGATVVSGHTPLELLFLCAKHLTVYRPEHYITSMFPTYRELKPLFFAALQVGDPSLGAPAELADAARQTAEALRPGMAPLDSENLRMIVRRFVEGGAKADLHKWIPGTEITGIRAGLIACCGSLEVAAKILRSEPVLPDGLSTSDKLKELVLYAVSDQYFQVRQALGLAIQ